MVGDEVKAGALLEGTPRFTDRATKTAGNDVRDVPSQVLVSTIGRVKLDGGMHEDLEVCIEISTAFMHPVEQETYRPMCVLCIFPGRSVPTPMWRASSLGQRRFLKGNSPLLVAAEVALKNDVDGRAHLGMLNEHPSQHGKTSLKNCICRAVVLALFGDEEGQVVGRVLRIGSNGSGHIDGQLRSLSF